MFKIKTICGGSPRSLRVGRDDVRIARLSGKGNTNHTSFRAESRNLGVAAQFLILNLIYNS